MNKQRRKERIRVTECGACRNEIPIADEPVTFKRYHYRLQVTRMTEGYPCTACGHVIPAKEERCYYINQ